MTAPKVTALPPRCPKTGCNATCIDEVCPDHGAMTYNDAHEWNDASVQVWLRSDFVSYSSVLPRRQLMPNGTVRGSGFEAFLWEKWP